MDKIIQAWSPTQLRMISGCKQAILLTGPLNKGPFRKTLHWPNKQQDPTALSHVAKAALRNKQPVLKTLHNQNEKTGEPLDALACPLFMKKRLLGVIAIETTHRSQPRQKALVRTIQLGTIWLETMLKAHGATSKEQLTQLVDLMAAGLEHEQYRVAATEVTNLLAAVFSCHRVSLGFMRRKRMRLEALSHSSRIDQHSNLVRAIREAMVESMDQAETVTYPPTSADSALITRFHDKLANMQHGAAICTLTLVH